ncbi:MAG: hypothetical protein CMP95_05060 [Gammaproteobacteria bacterium]|nr:hypothetical protein [Gammaproteobacteria bacterium]|tara:strand:+ start:1662 stop:1982 length:321 start_codon:yes stop_codon:yes gene_type:complete
MGYRSQVWIGVHDDYRQDFKLLEKEYGEFFYRKGRCKRTNVTVYKTRWDTKWYSEIEPVSSYEDIIKADTDRNWIVAIGEDNAIHTDLGDWWDHIDMEMKVKLNLD